jgi:hypothetical protein
MPNHVHLVLGTAEAPLDHFMQCLQQSYTQRFNRRYAQVGHVFQARYNHQNPVRAGLAARAEDYGYSGHRAYLVGVATELVDPTLVLRLVGGRTGYERLIASDLQELEPGTADFWAPRAPRAPLPAALDVLARGLVVDVEVLRGSGRGRPASWARALAAYVLVRRLGYRVTDVASLLGRSVPTTSLAVGEVDARRSGDAALARQVDRLVESLETKVEA